MATSQDDDLIYTKYMLQRLKSGRPTEHGGAEHAARRRSQIWSGRKSKPREFPITDGGSTATHSKAILNWVDVSYQKAGPPKKWKVLKCPRPFWFPPRIQSLQFIVKPGFNNWPEVVFKSKVSQVVLQIFDQFCCRTTSGLRPLMRKPSTE